MPVGGKPTGQSIKAGTVPPVLARPPVSHASTKPVSITAPVPLSQSGTVPATVSRVRDAQNTAAATVPHASPQSGNAWLPAVYRAPIQARPFFSRYKKHWALGKEKRIAEAIAKQKKLKITEEIAKKIATFPWKAEALAAGKGLNTGDTQSLAKILAHVSWVKNPKTARHYGFQASRSSPTGAGVPNDAQLMEAQTIALRAAGGNTEVRARLKKFFTEVGGSNDYQLANIMGSEEQMQQSFDVSWDEKHAQGGLFWDMFMSIL